MHREIKPMELTLRQREILKILKKSSLNSAQVTAKLKDSPSRRMVQLDLTKLEKARLITRIGKSRSIIWKINFRDSVDGSSGRKNGDS